VLGPSGAGKTTLLRAVAGLDRLSGGEVRIGGVVATRLEPRDRNVAMVFQSGALYPFMNVRENVSFPLKMRRHPAGDIEARVLAEGRALGIEELMQRRPGELSAGHQQLVHIARAMVRAPDVFLMDEPLSRLDAALRSKMRDELRMIQQGYGVTTLYVTNDPLEAMAMADAVAVLVDGALVQTGPPLDVYRMPASRRVAEIMGDASFLDVAVTADADGFWLTADGIRLRAWAPALGDHVGTGVQVMVRPEDLEVRPGGAITGTIADVTAYGSHVLVRCAVGSAEVAVRTATTPGRPGDPVTLDARRYVVFESGTGRRIG
jgi:ABC-type sugar transport system ATPase subunit